MSNNWVLKGFYLLKDTLITIATEIGPMVTTAIPTAFAANSVVHTWPTLGNWQYPIIIGMWLTGIATVKGALRAYTWNKMAITDKGNLRKGYVSLAPFRAWLTASVAYYIIELFLVVALEAVIVITSQNFALADNWPLLANSIAPATFVFMSAIGNIVLGLMITQQTLEEESRNFRKTSENLPANHSESETTSEQLPEWIRQVPKNKKEFRRYVQEGLIDLPAGLTGAELSNYVPVSPRSAQDWLGSVRNGRSK